MAVSFNLSRALQGKVHVQYVQIPQDLNVELEIELDQKLFDILSRNPTWLQMLQSKAKARADLVVEEMRKITLQVDATASLFDRSIAAKFNAILREKLNAQLRVAGKAMADESVRLFEDFKKGQRDLTFFQIKCCAKIGITAIVSAGSIAMSVLTAGALSPLGIWGVVKSGLTVVQECVKLASNVEMTGKLVDKEFVFLKKIMNENIAAQTTGRKIRQGAAEIALNVASRAVGLDTPSMKNCKGHIDLYKTNIAKLEKESRKLSEVIYKAMDLQESYSNKCKNAVKYLPAKEVGKIRMSLEQSEKALDTLLKNTIDINVSIEKANDRHKKYEETIDAMMKGLPKYLTLVDFVLSTGVDIASGIGDAATSFEKASGAIYTSVTSIESELLDNIG